jgi:hypothetical protein
MLILSNYTNAKERSLMAGKVGGASVLLLAEYYYILL